MIGYAMQSYSITGSATAPKINVPGVSYGALRIGGNIRLGLMDRLGIHLGAAFQQPLSYGEIKTTYFPNLSANGMDAWLAVSYAVLKNVEVKVGIDYTRFGFKMNPKPGDTFVAGGALDDYKAMGLAVSYML